MRQSSYPFSKAAVQRQGRGPSKLARGPALLACLGLAIAGLAVPSPAQAAPAYITDPASYVDTIVGTSGGGNVFPGATLPFGMFSFSPDNQNVNNPQAAYPSEAGYLSSSASGYIWANTNQYTRGFGLAHMSGNGCRGGGGDVPIFPMPGRLTQAPTAVERTSPIRTTIDHTTEEGLAGYYHTGLGNDVDVKLTATERTGSAIFTFPENVDNEGSLLIRSAESLVGTTDATVTIDPVNRRIEGYADSGNFCGYVAQDRVDNKTYYRI
ncbi:MAG: hypothetical protein LBG70_01240, partial [Bifidobacteriaceae bacterium]|nr:hypothetical protein [Bifidobacteriaceae bacterium]